MDAFYASVEQLDRPELRGKPVIVGGISARGVVSTASYEARPFGVRSAMATLRARQLCPHGIFVEPRHARYVEISRQVFAILRRYSPLVEGLSLDEAFIDVTQSRMLYGSGEAIARHMKDAIFEETGLTVSAGVATTKFAAKLASDMDKPDGLVVVPEDIVSFLAPLPIARMWGVGPKAAERLHALGIRTFRDAQNRDPATLAQALGSSWGSTIGKLCRGIDAREVVVDRPAKSISAEDTFEVDLRDREMVLEKLLSQSVRVTARLVRSQLLCGGVGIKIKDGRFQSRTRQTTLAQPAGDTDAIYSAARDLFRAMPMPEAGVRLTGVTARDLRPETAPQGELFQAPSDDKKRRLERTVLAISDRFGKSGVGRAALLGKARNRSD